MVWITTDNVVNESWRNLLEFANQELAIEAISSKHGPITKSNKANYQKQAQQIRVCILQAKEYFEAAENSSLITSPNHLYYGMVSLCSAIMLLLSDGNKSLDKLRQTNTNNNHGLDFTTAVNSKNCHSGLTILSQSFIAVRQNGFFLNFYSSLPTDSPIFGLVTKSHAHGSSTNRGLIGADRYWNSNEMSGYKSSILDLMKYLPDLDLVLKLCGVNVASSRLHIERSEKNDEISYQWTIHGTQTKEDLEKIISQFVIEEDLEKHFTKKIYDAGNAAHLKITVSQGQNFTFPSLRENISNQNFVYGTELHKHEIIDSLMTSYGLSMLSRYFPDIWVGCLESHCKASKLVEMLVFSFIKKIPVLALRLMHGQDYVISTHKPDWH